MKGMIACIEVCWKAFKTVALVCLGLVFAGFLARVLFEFLRFGWERLS